MGFQLPPGKEREYRARAGELLPAVLLTPPPSTNNLFDTFIRPRKGLPCRGPFGHLRTVRPKTKEYEDWIEENAPAARLLRSPASYPVVLRYTLVGKWYKARDIGNVEKPCTDLLVAEGVLADDKLNYVVGIELRLEASEAAARVKAEIVETRAGLFGA